MRLGRIIGSVWATRKEVSLAKYKLLTVEINDNLKKDVQIAADTLGAGVGELVITVGGSGARVGEEIPSVPIDATVVAIVDEKKLFIEKGKEHV